MATPSTNVILLGNVAAESELFSVTVSEKLETIWPREFRAASSTVAGTPTSALRSARKTNWVAVVLEWAAAEP